MQLWEYRTEVTRERDVAGAPPRESPIDGIFKKRRIEGWELVGVTRRDVRIDDTIQTETLYAFKRPTRSVNR
jgi:hypothetical protein